MKKISLILVVLLLLTSLAGCSGTNDEHENQPQEVYDNQYTDEVDEQVAAIEENYDTAIKVENGIAFFDMNAEEFVEAYNNTLTSESDYVAKSLATPQYTTSGTGIQQTTIYQYDVSNKLGSIHTFVHTDENDKILELSIGIEKVFGNVNVDLVDVLYNNFGEMVTVLSDFSDSDWQTLADGLSYKIANKSSSLHYYHKGIVIDSYSNENAVYFRVSSMTEEMYNNLIN